MTDFFPNRDHNYMYAPERQWEKVARTKIVHNDPMINIDYGEDGAVIGVEVLF